MASRQAVVGFLIGSAVTLTLSILWNRSKRQRKKDDKSSSTTTTRTTRSIPQELRDEQLSRHTLYFGDDGMASLRNAKIVVVGVGGVGSHTAHMLARAGVGRLRLIDFDQVTLSSLNRHACATLQDVGTPKATCLKEFCERLCPDPNYLRIEDVVQMYTAESGPALLAGHEWDLVIDAIDDVPTKAALLAYCVDHNIKVISCMGAGGKSDMTRLHLSDLRTASRDPLASKLRQSLKRMRKGKDLSFLDDMDKLSIIYSSEKTVVKLADFTEEQKKQGVHQYGAVDGMRIRIIPVLGTMPAIMGQALAAAALCDVGGKPFMPVTGERVGKNVRHRIKQHLQNREVKIRAEKTQNITETTTTTAIDDNNNGQMIDGVWVGPIQVDADDVEYLLEVWRNRCAITGDRLGATLELARWDLSKPSVCQNLILLSKAAMMKFDQNGGKDSVPKNIQEIIEARLRTCRVDAYA